MRVYELDEHFGVSKEAVKEALEATGADSSHHQSAVSDDEMAALEAYFGKAPAEDLPTEVDEESDQDPLPPFSNELKKSPGSDDPKKDEEESMAKTFEKVDMSGRLVEKLQFEPKQAAKLDKMLKSRKIADSTLYPERGELVVVTWPDMQKLVVR